MDKLEFLNSMHIRNRFDPVYNSGRDPVDAWRSMLIEHLDESLHPSIKTLPNDKMSKIMNLMKIRIHFFKDLKNHTYFFTDPQYLSDIADKFLSKLKQPDSVK